MHSELAPTAAPGHLDQLRAVLTDPDRPWGLRLARLQGWRGEEAEQAMQASWGARSAPAVCGLGSLAAAALMSPALSAVLGVTALIGVFSHNHPVQSLYNVVARRVGWPVLPPNRAGSRLGCAMGVVHLGGAAVAFGLGYTVLGVFLAGSLGLAASFVASTGICLPSVMLTLQLGAERVTRPSLFAALRG